MTQDLRNPSDPAADLNTVCSNVTRNGIKGGDMSKRKKKKKRGGNTLEHTLASQRADLNITEAV